MFWYNLITRLSSPTTNSRRRKMIVKSCSSLEGFLRWGKQHLFISPRIVRLLKVRVSHFRMIPFNFIALVENDKLLEFPIRFSFGKVVPEDAFKAGKGENAFRSAAGNYWGRHYDSINERYSQPKWRFLTENECVASRIMCGRFERRWVYSGEVYTSLTRLCGKPSAIVESSQRVSSKLSNRWRPCGIKCAMISILWVLSLRRNVRWFFSLRRLCQALLLFWAALRLKSLHNRFAICFVRRGNETLFSCQSENKVAARS